MGGSSAPPPPPQIIQQSASPPAAPDPLGQARASLQAQLEYAPQFREQNIQDIMQLGQAAANAEEQYGIPLAEQETQALRTIEPETYATQVATAQKIQDMLQNPLTPEAEAAYRERFAGEEANAGRLGSPIGSASIARELTDLSENNRLQAVSAGLSYLNRTPLGVPTLPVQTGSAGTPGYLAGPVLGSTSSIYGTQGNVYGAQLGAATSAYNAGLGYTQNAQNNRYGLYGGLISAAGSLGSAGIIACLPKGTMIQTEDGVVPVEDLEIGDEVIGGKVIAVIRRARPEGHRFYNVRTTDGDVVMSKGHPCQSIVLEETVVGNRSRFTYDILTESGRYIVNGVVLGSTIPHPQEVAHGV